MTSNLSEEVLAQIWDLADTHHSGKFTKLEFAIAMFLVQQKLQGRELPTTLPSSLLSSVSNSTQQQHQRVGSTSSTPAPPSSINDLLSLGNALASPTQTTPTTSFPEPASSNVRQFVPTSQFGQIISKEKNDGFSEVPNNSVPPTVVSRVTSPSSNRLSTPPVASSGPAPAPASAPASLPPVPAHSFGTVSNSSTVPVAVAAPTAPAAPASRSILAAPVAVGAAAGAAAGLAGSAVVDVISSFGSHNQQSSSALRGIDNQIKDVNGQVSSISNNNSQLNGQVDAISAQLAQSKEKLEYAQSELKRVSAMKETLQAKLVSTQAEFETDSKKLSDVQGTLQETQNEFDSLSANYSELQSSHESLKGQIVDAATKLEQEKQQNAELDEQIDDIQTELQILEEQFETLDKDSRQQSGLLAINKKKFTGLEAQKEELTTKIAELQNELETTNTQLLEVEGTHTSINTETEELKSKVETATAEIDNLKSQVETTSKEVENLKVEIENSKAKFTSLEQEKASLHEELVKLQADKEESLTELAKINEKTQLLTSDISKLQKERETTKTEFIANQTAKSEVKANLEKLESEKTLDPAAPIIVGKEKISSTASRVEDSQPESLSINKSIELASDKAASDSVVSKIGETSKVEVSKQVTGEKPMQKSVDIATDNVSSNSTNIKAEEPASKIGNNSVGIGAGIAAAAVGASAVVGSVLFSKANEEAEKVKPVEITPAVEEIISPAEKHLDSTDIKEDIPVDSKSDEPKKPFSCSADEYQSNVLDSSISIAPSESVSNESITSDSNIQEPVTINASIRSLIAEPISTSIRDDLKEDVDSSKDQNSLSLSVSEAASKSVAEPSSLIESVHSAESYDIIDKNEIPPISKISEPASVDKSESVTEESEPFTIPGSMSSPIIPIENNSAFAGKSTTNEVSDEEDAESQYSDAIEPAEEASSSKYESRLKDSDINGHSYTIDTSDTTDSAASTSESDIKASTKAVVESEPISKISESEITTPPIDVEKIPIASVPGDAPTLAPTTEPVSLDVGEFTPVAAHSDSTISLQGFKADTANMDSFKAASIPTSGSLVQENSAIEPQNVVFPIGHDILSARDEFDKAFESLNNDSANVWPTTSASKNGFDDFDKAFSAESGFSRADEEDEQTHGTVPFVQTAPVAEHNTGSDLSYTTTPVFAQAPSGQFSTSQVETEAPRNFSIEANSPFAPAQPAEMPSTHPFFAQRDYNDESLPAFLRNKNDVDPFDAAFDGLMAAEEEKDGDFGNGHAGPAHSSTAFPPVVSSLGTFPNDGNVQHGGNGPAPTVSNSEWDSIFAGFTNENTETTSGNIDDAFNPAVPSLDKPFGGVLKHLEDEYSHLDQRTQQKLQNLTSMGFDKARALEALEKNNFNIEDASNFLLDQ